MDKNYSAPLEGVLVVDLSQFLAGPLAALRLQELGARVIKVEKPVEGDISRSKLVLGNQFQGEVSHEFHIINRGKESLVLDLKSQKGIDNLKQLLLSADVLIHNFRPGVMERLGLSFEELKKSHPHLIYAWISGYGEGNIFAEKPGVDLIVQGVAGLTGLSTRKGDVPVPFGSAVSDISASTQILAGINALLYRRAINGGLGGKVETSLFEAAVDLQFDLLAAALNTQERDIKHSSAKERVHAFTNAPAGIYKVSDGYIIMAMSSVTKVLEILAIDKQKYLNSDSWWEYREEIQSLISDALLNNSKDYWLELFTKEDIWANEVLDTKSLLNSELIKELEIIKTFKVGDKWVESIRTPIRVDGQILWSEDGAPSLGEDTVSLAEEFGLTL